MKEILYVVWGVAVFSALGVVILLGMVGPHLGAACLAGAGLLQALRKGDKRLRALLAVLGGAVLIAGVLCRVLVLPRLKA